MAATISGTVVQVRLAGHFDVDEPLREDVHGLGGHLGERPAVLEHGGHQLQRREDAVAGGVVVEEDDVAGVLAAQDGAHGPHVLEHVAVAHLGGVVA